ncbi:MAG: LysR family transcriptional regulator [Gordonibacter sp.]|nr:LysR family transcriptional regulator [Gordonibacter sp.]
MKTEFLREFVTLAHYGNFHMAAEKLFISQPTLSSHIKALEQETGHVLFDRDNENALTTAGSLLLDASQSVLATLDTFAEECQGMDVATCECKVPVRVGVYVPPTKVHAILENRCPYPYTYAEYDIRKPILYPFTRNYVDVMCTYDLETLPNLKSEAESLGLKYASFGTEVCAIAMKETNPLAQGTLTRERLRDADVMFASAVDYGYWKASLNDIFGEDMGFKVHVNAISTLESMRSFDLGDAIIISFAYMIDGFFAWRDGYVARYTVDEKPLYMREGVVWRPCPDNPDIGRVALLLRDGASG